MNLHLVSNDLKHIRYLHSSCKAVYDVPLTNYSYVSHLDLAISNSYVGGLLILQLKY